MDDLEAITERLRKGHDEDCFWRGMVSTSDGPPTPEEWCSCGLIAALDSLLSELRRVKEELANKHGGDGTVLHVSRESQDALYVERDRLREENEDLKRPRCDAVEGHVPVERLRAEIAFKRGLRAELTRLREIEKAARDIISIGDAFHDAFEFPTGWWPAFETLRNALQPQTEKETS